MCIYLSSVPDEGGRRQASLKLAGIGQPGSDTTGTASNYTSNQSSGSGAGPQDGQGNRNHRAGDQDTWNWPLLIYTTERFSKKS